MINFLTFRRAAEKVTDLASDGPAINLVLLAFKSRQNFFQKIQISADYSIRSKFQHSNLMRRVVQSCG